MATVKQLVVRITAEEVAVLDSVMSETGYVSMSDVVRHVIRQYASEHGFPRTTKRKAAPKP